MEKLRRKFKSASQLSRFIEKHDGVVAAADELGVDRRTLYEFRLEMGII